MPPSLQQARCRWAEAAQCREVKRCVLLAYDWLFETVLINYHDTDGPGS